MSGSFVVSLLLGVTAVMAAVLGVTRILRRRRAATRHALLTAAFAVVLVLPMAAGIAPYITIRVPLPAPAAVIEAVASLDADTPLVPPQIAPVPASSAPTRRGATVSLATVIQALWFLGLVACFAPVAIGLFQMRSLGGHGLPWQHGRVLTEALAASFGLRGRVDDVVLHDAVSGPMTYGTLRPTIVLPIDAERWADDELMRAIVHELEHIRRADWLTQCLARTLCAGYWFHPLVWIARRQLVLEAERAADDAVLAYADASAYADQLVDLARRLSTGHQPLLAMANRRDLAVRVRALLDGRQPRGRAGAWLVAGLSCVAAALVTVLSPMRIVAQSPKPRFDVVSVRLCDPTAPPAAPSAAGRGRNLGQASPGRFRLDCQNVNALILDAYVKFANGHYNPPSADRSFDRWHAGPDWIRSERFTIEATADDTTPLWVMRGPMLQAVLEDHFKLKVHHETREVPVLELVVTKGGAKLTPFVAGTCVPYDYSAFPQPPVEPGQRRCVTRTDRGSDGNWVEIVEAATLDDWVRHFDDSANVAGQPPIVNKTGITGLQSFRYEYSGRSDDRAAEFKNQLGLELRPARGSQEFLILDHVERPTSDPAVAAL